jgi:hypothetical protein
MAPVRMVALAMAMQVAPLVPPVRVLPATIAVSPRL